MNVPLKSTMNKDQVCNRTSCGIICVRNIHSKPEFLAIQRVYSYNFRHLIDIRFISGEIKNYIIGLIGHKYKYNYNTNDLTDFYKTIIMSRFKKLFSYIYTKEKDIIMSFCDSSFTLDKFKSIRDTIYGNYPKRKISESTLIYRYNVLNTIFKIFKNDIKECLFNAVTYENSWSFPKGRRELYKNSSEYEDAIVTAHREFKEETSISTSELSVNEDLYIIDSYYSWGTEYKSIYFIATENNVNSISLDDVKDKVNKYECNDIKWISYDELNELGMSPIDKNKLNTLFKTTLKKLKNTLNVQTVKPNENYRNFTQICSIGNYYFH